MNLWWNVLSSLKKFQLAIERGGENLAALQAQDLFANESSKNRWLLDIKGNKVLLF